MGYREDARGRARSAGDGGDADRQGDLFVPHQANLRINQFVGQKLGIPEAKTVHNIEKYGNTTAATIPLGLSEAWFPQDGSSPRCDRGSNVLFAAFGSGYTWGGAVVTL